MLSAVSTAPSSCNTSLTAAARNYIPVNDSERAEMLRTLGLKSVDELFSQIPSAIRTERLELPNGMSELEVRRYISSLAEKNKRFRHIFRGAGAYNHYIPAIVNRITSKEEFLTAYTPYQAEISQGVLQSIYEYQTMICELTGLDVSNASVYDGATAAAEAVAMCVERKRTRMLVSSTVHPMTLRTVQTYSRGSGVKIEVIPSINGTTDLEAIKTSLNDTVAGVLLQSPNYYGLIEESASAAGEAAHANGAKFVMSVNPVSLGILKPPSEYGADIAVGEGQPLGLPLSFGGPYLGFMATTTALQRKLPGRIVGETTDMDGKRAFVLTLQAREQHIRREKASSNICSNQALCAMTAAVYMSAMGPEGLREVAKQCIAKAHYAAGRITAVKGYKLRYNGEFFNEFVTECPVPLETILAKLEEQDILGGYPTANNGIIWCVTEMNTKEEIDRLAEALA
jgi:glycine dehydrogenase subunit 1